MLGSCLLAVPAQAGYVVSLQEVGSDVVATGSGPIDLTALTSAGTGGSPAGMVPNTGDIFTGPVPGVSGELYSGFTGPASFGSGGFTPASSGSGDLVGFFNSLNFLVVPSGYLSGNPLSDTATYLNETFGTLGVNPGTYVWSWGGGPDQNFTLIIGTPVAVPEPASVALLGTTLAGLLLTGTVRRRRPKA